MSQDTRPDPRTLAAQALGLEDPLTGAVVPPLYLSTTYTRDENYAPRATGTYIRDASPTVAHAEAVIAALEQGVAALCFGSGMAACTAPLHALEAGDHVVCGRTVYHGVIEWLERFAAARGIRYDWFETGDLAALAATIRPETRLVWLETPANPTWAITDIAAACAIAHGAGARLAVDSTCATPVLTRPLELGADLVCHAATKYLGGHSDVLAGALITRETDDFWQRIVDHRRLGGAMLGAMDAYLLIRGLRTLYLRVERQCANARAVAEFLSGHPAVERVLYPGLPDHPGHAVAARQMRGGYGGMLSFQPRGDAQTAIDAVRRCRIWKPATSLGGTESLIEHRRSSEGDIRTTTPDNLIRLSTGIEAVADLIDDLDRALAG